ncbi:MAG: site-specific integrase [Clostridia bacterium]|nr:site-specific integrase [Clostridia bacterium]
MTVAQWLTIWQRDFLGNVKPGTAISYEMQVRVHIVPTLGEIKLTALRTPVVQRLYNQKLAQGMSPKSIKNIHGCLHRALDMAVRIGYLTKNPTSACILPTVRQAEIHPLDTPDLKKLLESIHGDEYEALILTAIFTGMRSGELLGLTWDCIDFENGIIRVVKQLVQPRKKGRSFSFGTPKNGKGRTLTPAPFVMEVLKEHKKAQVELRKAAGPAWDDGGFPNLVFTHPDGSHLSQPTVWKALQKILEKAGLESHRFHDLRHTYVVNAFRAGDDVKTVQQNAGHYSAAFTLDRYAHVTETMRKESADRMQNFFEAL